MRNLKRVLSLALALVMVLGMMVVTTSAATFTDEESIKYTEAVEVMSAIGVIDGVEAADGTFAFNPTETLTREQGAKIVCYMLMGKTAAEKLVGSGKFDDVAATRWSAGAIDYCATLGILDGVGNNKFDPTGELKAVQFGKMLLCALGYDADVEGYTGSNWATYIATDMIEIGLDLEGVAMDAQLTREQAAQMAFKALTSTMVEYETKGTTISVNGMNIVSGASAAKEVTRDENGVGEPANYATGTAGVDTLQFCEKYFKYLHKDGGAADDFTRTPSHGWWLDADKDGVRDGGERIYNQLNKAAVTYTGAVNFAKVASDLAGYTFGGTELKSKATTYAGDGDATWGETLVIGDLTLTEDSTGVAGDATGIANAVAALTGNGKVVEIYVSRTGAVIDVNVITATVEKITNIVTNAVTGDVTYTLTSSGSKVMKADEDELDDMILYGEFTKGAIVTTVAGTTFLHVYPTTTFQGAQSAFNTTYETVVIGGETYEVGTGVTGVSMGSFTNSKYDANYFVDQYGYVVAKEGISTIYTNYAQVKGHTAAVVTTIDGSAPVVTARFLLADGTVATYNVNVDYNRGTGVYSIAGTTIGDIDVDGADSDTGSALVESSVQTAVATALADNTAYGYEIDEDGAISLQAIGTTRVANTMIQRGIRGTIDTGAASVQLNNGNATVTLLTEETVYVLYNAVTKTATTYVGTLPAGTSLSSGSTVVVALMDSTRTNATAKVVFGSIYDVAALGTREFAWVDADVYTTELISGYTYRVYEGIKADGTKVTLYDYDAYTVVGSTDGLYTWDTNMDITGAYSTGVVGAQTYSVVGNQMICGTDVFNMADANVIYIARNRTMVDGSSCVVVREVVGGTPTANAAVIYVVG